MDEPMRIFIIGLEAAKKDYRAISYNLREGRAEKCRASLKFNVRRNSAP